MIHQVQIKSLPQEWLWCETWCSDESKATAKTIDMVSVSFFFTHRFLVDEERKIVFLFCFIISGCEFPAIGFVTRFCLIIPARFKYIPSRYLLFQSYQRKRQNSEKSVESQQQKHQNDLIDVVLMYFLLTLNIFHTLFCCFHCCFERVNAGWIYANLDASSRT